MNINDFLTQFVDGYLLSDLNTLRDAHPTQGTNGYVGYPLLQSAFAGIELLGALTSEGAFDGERRNKEYFLAFWRRMYRYGVQEKAGKALYQLVRNGLAHSFLVKGKITVTKSGNGPHLQWVNGELVVDAFALSISFENAYRAVKLGDATEWPNAQQRLDEMVKAAGDDWEQWKGNLERLQEASPSAARVFAGHGTPSGGMQSAVTSSFSSSPPPVVVVTTPLRGK